MELFIPHTPLAIFIIALLLVIMILKLIIDAKEVKASRRLHRTIMTYVRQHNIPQFNVVIELRKTADTIFPLLDHLYEHDYDALEIIVIVRHTAGKFAQSKLQYYRRKQQHNNLKIIKHTKGMTVDAAIGRYASGSLVMQLEPTSRLLKNFFAYVALEFLEDHIDVVLPRRHIVVDNSLMSAVRASMTMWQQVFAVLTTQLHNDNNLVVGRVYRQQSLIKKSNLRCLYTKRIAITQPPLTSRQSMRMSRLTTLSTKKAQQVALGMLAATGIASVVLWNQNLLLLTEFLLLGYLFAYGLVLMATSGYSAIERLTLLLFAPFSPFFITGLFIYSSLRVVYNTGIHVGRRMYSVARLAWFW